MGAVVIVQQGRDLRVSHENNVSTITTITAIGTTQRLELFPVHRNTPVTPMACREVQHNTVNERCHCATLLLCEPLSEKGEPKLALALQSVEP